MPARRWPPDSACRRGCFAPRVIGINDALCGAARCRGVALIKRSVATFKVIVVPALVDLQADRVGGVIRLGPGRRSRRNRRDNQNCQSLQNCQSWNAHPSLLESLEPTPAVKLDRALSVPLSQIDSPRDLSTE
jgi:hypothetical protein